MGRVNSIFNFVWENVICKQKSLFLSDFLRKNTLLIEKFQFFNLLLKIIHFRYRREVQVVGQGLKSGKRKFVLLPGERGIIPLPHTRKESFNTLFSMHKYHELLLYELVKSNWHYVNLDPIKKSKI